MSKQQLYTEYLVIAENMKDIKSNSYRYKQDRKDKALRDKISSCLDGYITSMTDKGQDPKERVPLINMAKVLVYESGSETSSDDSDVRK